MIRIKCEVLDFSFEDHISIIGNSGLILTIHLEKIMKVNARKLLL